MVRMAGRLAENFIRDDKRIDNEPLYRSRANSRMFTSKSSVSSSNAPAVSRKLTTNDGSDPDDPGILDAIKDANMDAVHHLSATNPLTRTLWCAIIIVFVILALIQCYSQIQLFLSEPVATNIEAHYPKRIAFPTVAICNNNQFRLTYLTGGRIMNRRAKNIVGNLLSIGHQTESVFDTVMRKSWDMDAVKFLRSAAHWKSRMILGCTWPNGTACQLRDFKAVWTTTGLCWAINTDPNNPVEVTGSGAGHGLRLLLNVESYERVDACTKHFRTRSLPGLKILIYNQTDVPESSMTGVNVPSGYSMDIPFKMQHRFKLSGTHCIEETDEHRAARDDFNHPDNIRTCTLRKYMDEVESSCGCTLRRAFTPNITHMNMNPCNVDEYFGCALSAMNRVRETGTANTCLPPCSSIDYTAWQDMNRLPLNLMPALIEEQEEDDEDEVDQDEFEDNLPFSSNNGETFSCEDSAYLDDKQVTRIKRDAHRAYEMQARHQEDIFLRSRRLITRLRNAILSLERLKWGWHDDTFRGVYDRLSEIKCFANFSERHLDIVSILESRPITSEERKANQMFYLLDENEYKRNTTRFKSIGELKSKYGDKVDEVAEEIAIILKIVEKLWHIFMPSSYQRALTGDFSRMDRIMELINQYELNKLQRRAWAEKMQSRQMKHFFDEDFYESYYQIIMRDLDQSLVKQLDEVEHEWEKVQYYLNRGTAGKTGAIMFFGDGHRLNREKFERLLTEMHNCTSGKLRTEAGKLLSTFKKSYRELHAAYSKLFKEELQDYLENFEFGNKFVSDNFAMVNIFLHKMNLEVWSQDRTYGFWSLACDIGGALGLFLGISLLTIIELVYLCIQYGFCGKKARNFQCIPMETLTRNVKSCITCECCRRRHEAKVPQKPLEKMYKKNPQIYQRRYTDDTELYRQSRSRTGSREPEADPRFRTSIWKDDEYPHGSNASSMSAAEINNFMNAVQNTSKPPPDYKENGDDNLNPGIVNKNDDLLSPTTSEKERLTDISEEKSHSPDERVGDTSGYQTDEHRSPNLTRHANPDIEIEPVSISEVSETLAPPLFRSPKPNRQSYV